MKIFVILSCAAVVFAQNIGIGAPAPGATLAPGSEVVVSIIRGDTLTPSTEVGVGITLKHCLQSPCEDVTQQLGSTLFAGPFNPQAGSSFDGEPFENFTVTIPTGFTAGSAELSVEHASLVGAGPFFFTEIVNETVTIS